MRSLVLTVAVIAGLSGTAIAGEHPFVGEISVFGGKFCPSGYAAADGSLREIVKNHTLFALLGKTYGGDGHCTFGLPNLQPLATKSGASLTMCIAVDGIYPHN